MAMAVRRAGDIVRLPQSVAVRDCTAQSQFNYSTFAVRARRHDRFPSRRLETGRLSTIELYRGPSIWHRFFKVQP